MAVNSTLKQIIAEAKRIKKAHPKKFAKWTEYVKYAATKIKPAKKVAAKKIRTKKNVKGYTIVEQSENPKAKKKKILVQREANGTFRNFKKISGVSQTKSENLFKQVNRLGSYADDISNTAHPKSKRELQMNYEARNKFLKLHTELEANKKQMNPITKQVFEQAIAHYNYWTQRLPTIV